VPEQCATAKRIGVADDQEELARGSFMNRIAIAVLAAGISALAACRESPEEAQAENIQANAEAAADAFEEAADNAGNENVEEALENAAEGIREGGENIADQVVDNSAE
jgi:outer membrane PBP1 activator LpoA protein